MILPIEFYKAMIAGSVAFFFVTSLVRKEEGKLKDYAGNLVGIGQAFALWFIGFSSVYFFVNPFILGFADQVLSNAQTNDLALILISLSVFAFTHEISKRAKGIHLRN
jgi:NO-binding membrane sensor protein with MHYT domain